MTTNHNGDQESQQLAGDNGQSNQSELQMLFTQFFQRLEGANERVIQKQNEMLDLLRQQHQTSDQQGQRTPRLQEQAPNQNQNQAQQQQGNQAQPPNANFQQQPQYYFATPQPQPTYSTFQGINLNNAAYEPQQRQEYYAPVQIRLKEYSGEGYLHEYLQYAVGVIRQRFVQDSDQKKDLFNHLPMHLQFKMSEELDSSNITFSEFIGILKQKQGQSKQRYLREFQSLLCGETDDVENYIDKMYSLGKAAEQSDERIITQIQSRLPKFIGDFLIGEFSNLSRFKAEAQTTLLLPSCVMYKQFLEKEMKAGTSTFTQEDVQQLDNIEQAYRQGKGQNQQNQGHQNQQQQQQKTQFQISEEQTSRNEAPPQSVGGRQGTQLQQYYANFEQPRNHNNQQGRNNQKQSLPASVDQIRNNQQQYKADMEKKMELMRQEFGELIKEHVDKRKENSNTSSISLNPSQELQSTLAEFLLDDEEVKQNSEQFVGGFLSENQDKALEQNISSEDLQCLQVYSREMDIQLDDDMLESFIGENKRQRTEQGFEGGQATDGRGNNNQYVRNFLQGVKKKQDGLFGRAKQIVLDSDIAINVYKELDYKKIIRNVSVPMPLVSLIPMVNQIPEQKKKFQDAIEQLLPGILTGTFQPQNNQGVRTNNHMQQQRQQNRPGTRQMVIGSPGQGTSNQDQNMGMIAEANNVNLEQKVSDIPLSQLRGHIEEYRTWLKRDKNELMITPISINNQTVKCVVDTGSMGTLIPASKAKELGIWEQVIVSKDKHIPISGIGGVGRVIGWIPELHVLFGKRSKMVIVGIVEGGRFDILLGNDTARQLNLVIYTKDRYCTYDHPALGVQTLHFIERQESDKVYSNVVLFQDTIETELVSHQTQQELIQQVQAQNEYELMKRLPVELVELYKLNHLGNLQGSLLTRKQLNEITQYVFLDRAQRTARSYVLYYGLFNRGPIDLGLTYDMLILDPAWKFQSYHNSGLPYCGQEYGELMHIPVHLLRKICSLILLWVTGTHLFLALNLLNLWQYRYINILVVWRKCKKDMTSQGRTLGNWSRITCEYLLIGAIGQVSQFRSHIKNVNQYIETVQLDALRTQHSVKPKEIYEFYNQMFNLQEMKVIELFARERNQYNQSFDIYGNELQPQFQQSEEKQGNQWSEYYNQQQSQQGFDKEYFSKYSEYIDTYVVPGVGNRIPEYKAQNQQTQEQILSEIEKVVKAQGPPASERIIKLFQKYWRIFQPKSVNLDKIENIEIHIVPGSKPVQRKNKQLTNEDLLFLNQEVSRLLSLGVVSRSDSLYNVSPSIVLKPNGERRFTLNLIPVNPQMKLPMYPAVFITDVHNQAEGCMYLTVLDLKDGFWQVTLPKKFRKFFAFSLTSGPYRGHYEFNVITQGSNISTALFQRKMDSILGKYYHRGIGAYIDDIYIMSPTLEEHLESLELVIQELLSNNMTISIKKCQLVQSSVNLLGFIISGDGLQPQPKKYAALQQVRPPTSFKELQGFMGTLNYYKRFLPNLSVAMKAFSACLKQNQFEWTELQQSAFEFVKQQLQDAVQVSHPDKNSQFRLCVDYNSEVYACCLYQVTEKTNIIGYASCIINDQQRKYSGIEQIFSALVWALEYFRAFLSRNFVMEQKNNLLEKLRRIQNPSQRVAGWQLIESKYEYQIKVVGPRHLSQLRMFLVLNSQTDQSLIIQKQQQLEDQLKQIPTERKERFQSISELEAFDVFGKFDGARNGGKCYAACVIYQNGIKVDELATQIEASTSNQAEYNALILLMQRVKKIRNSRWLRILIQGDSQLVIRQVNGDYKCNTNQLMGLNSRSQKLKKQFNNLVIEHVPREMNTECDELCKQAAQQEFNNGSLYESAMVSFLEVDQELRCIMQRMEVKSMLNEMGQIKECQNKVEDDCYIGEVVESTLNLRQHEIVLICEIGMFRQSNKRYYAYLFRTSQRNLIQRSYSTVDSDLHNYSFWNRIVSKYKQMVREGSNITKLIIAHDDSNLDQQGQFQLSQAQLGVEIEFIHHIGGTQSVRELLNYQQCNTQDLYWIKSFVTQFEVELEQLHCEICQRTKEEDKMMLCDYCGLGFHMRCMNYEQVPEGSFYCGNCLEKIAELNSEYMGEQLDPTIDVALLEAAMEPDSELRVRILASLLRSTDYVVIQGELYKEKDGQYYYVPKVGERQQLIKHMHYNASHAGSARTFQLVQDYFFWPSMRRDVFRAVKKCAICRADQPRFMLPAEHQAIQKPNRPFLTMHVDLMYLPVVWRRGQQFRAVMITIDSFSKWVELTPLTGTTAEVVWQAFENQIIFRYGCPLVVVSDNGPEFLGFFRDRLAERSVTHIYITPHNPQANGQVERLVRIVKQGLRRVCAEHQMENWTRLIQQVAFSIRILVSQSTRLTPFEVIFGHRATIPGYQQFQLVNFTSEEATVEQILLHVQRLQTWRTNPTVQRSLNDMQFEIQETMDHRERVDTSNLQLGQPVYVRNFQQSTLELASNGPFIFLEYTGDRRRVAVLYNPSSGRIHRVKLSNINPIQNL